jgi:hypothetical protein
VADPLVESTLPGPHPATASAPKKPNWQSVARTLAELAR